MIDLSAQLKNETSLFVRRAIALVAPALVIAACAGLSRAQAPPVPAPQTPRFIVVIDAAHGGDDTGAHLNDGAYEKAATLALSIRLRSLLMARGISVVTTRESDRSLDINQRAEIANRARADACISLHVADTGSGVHLFASNLAPIAAQRFEPWKTAQAAWVSRSLALAGLLNSALEQAGITVTVGRTTLPGIDSMTCPAVAIELAPERDKDNKLVSEPDAADYQARFATVLAAALLEWRSEARQP
jgi:N-acetylmuramoyl-L-alanine amidase